MCEKRYCAALGGEEWHIAFPYRKNGVIVNIKYRALEKHFSQSKGGEQIFYGYDDAKVSSCRCLPNCLPAAECRWMSGMAAAGSASSGWATTWRADQLVQWQQRKTGMKPCNSISNPGL
jgi:hypothetical protein